MLIRTLHSYVTYKDDCINHGGLASVQKVDLSLCSARARMVGEEVGVGVLFLFAISALFVGLVRKSRYWLIPYIIVSGCSIVGSLLFLGGELLGYDEFFPEAVIEPDEKKGLYLAPAFIALLCLINVFQLWSIVTLVRCYLFYLELHNYYSTAGDDVLLPLNQSTDQDYSSFAAVVE